MSTIERDSGAGAYWKGLLIVGQSTVTWSGPL
jgi:hypothetical protein